jgi:PAS domain S-box-containing protein
MSPRGRLSGYLVAILAVIAGVGLRGVLDPWLGEYLPFATLYGTVAVAVWWGGAAPAVWAAALGYLAADYLFVEPSGGLVGHSVSHLIGLAAYFTSSGIIIYLGSAMRAAQAQAQERLGHLSATITSIGDAVIATDAEGRVEWLNPAAQALTGWPQAEAKGLPLPEVFRVVNDVTRLPVENPAARAVREGRVVALGSHTLLITRQGVERPIDDSTAPIRDASGNATGCILVFRDVSDRRRSEAERHLNARLFASIVESSEDAILSKSPDGVIKSWNPAAETLFGHTAKVAVGRHIRLIVPQDRYHEEDRIMARLRNGERIRSVETVRVHKDGRLLEVGLTISPLSDAAGVVVGASSIARDIGPQKDAERRIYALMGQLEENDRRKDAFLATLGHELRGPLASIRSGLEILKRAPDASPMREQARAAMERQISQVERLVDDLLDLSRITHNRLELRRRRVELGPAIDQAVEACRPILAHFGHALRVEPSADPLPVYADPARLTQVVTNLLTNACKYTEPPGVIRLTTRREGGDAVVSVADNGIGIDSSMLPRIFEPFEQSDQAAGRSQGGLGIGLALVQQIVQLHQGTVLAISEGPNRGSEFVVRLPLMTERATGAAEPEVRPVGTRQRLRILVVDDNRDSADSLATLLGLMGNETRVAYDGPGAVAATDEFQPHIVLLDLGMPEIDGFETCRRLRRLESGKQAIVVALTGWGQPHDRGASREAGFDHHLVKPVDPAALGKVLAELTARDPRVESQG